MTSRPTGSPLVCSGVEVCGIPARFGPTVKVSMAYVCAGDKFCASCSVGGVFGIVGDMSTSTFLNASLYSCMILVLAFIAT